ncbi:imm11 family protein [Teredinibacter sp. KSP-S5-2]|uniref:imm11 family protein n=1 Tax=Teredinibacter sp. KSP-S5-2 TaxID=3034506 RepID=UPI002934F091|nr:DUF1629 domain-containing protein [Teredinibacter sp. KSP-S5-2]WNO10392.1 hypothetical protein P5V12_04335 [Teredinibacter sp. KSP-S5-2]
MKYYHFEVYDRQDPDYCFIERPPEQIALLSSYIMSGDRAESQYPEEVVAKMSDRGGRVLSDFIGNKELSIIAHESVKTIIEDVCGDTCEYLPVSIENHKGRIASDEYFYINPLGTFDCLNKEFSRIKYTDDGKVIRVKSFVFDREKLQEVPDLFRVPEDHSEYFMSERLVNAIKTGKPDVTNLNLQEKEVK